MKGYCGARYEKGNGMSKPACHCDIKHARGVGGRTTLFALLGGSLASAGFWTSGAAARATREAPRPEDHRFMRMAIAEAAKGDFPLGSHVHNGQVLRPVEISGRPQ